MQNPWASELETVRTLHFALGARVRQTVVGFKRMADRLIRAIVDTFPPTPHNHTRQLREDTRDSTLDSSPAVCALALPILMCILFGLGYLLSSLDDADAAAVVLRVNLGLAVLWVFDLILLVLAVAFSSVVHTVEAVADDDEILVQTDDELK